MSKLAEIVYGVFSVAPEADAIEFNGTWSSWGDLHSVARALDAHLAAAGLGAGSRVGIIMRNRPCVAASILGTISDDRCVVTLNPMLPDDKLAADIRELKPPVVLALREDWERNGVKDAAREVGCLGLQFSEDSVSIELTPGLERIT